MAKLPAKVSILITMSVCMALALIVIYPRKSSLSLYTESGDETMEDEDVVFPIEAENDQDYSDNLQERVSSTSEIKLGGDGENPSVDEDIYIDTSIFSSTEMPSAVGGMSESTTETFASTITAETTGDDRRKNVLFIMTDDMRPQLGAYNGEDFPMPYHKDKKMFTPNLDALAAKSILFKRAYVQYSLCGPSRTSMLTSRRPDTTRIFGNNNYWRHTGGNFTTLPQYFRNNGYKTVGIGKIFHKGKSSDKNDKTYSWSEKYYMPPYTDRHYVPGADDGAGWRAVTTKEREKIPLSDEYSVIKAKEYLRKLARKAKSGKQPFFMALGFKKPHLSLVCPEEYFHMYPLETSEEYLPEKGWQTPGVKDTVSMGDDDDDGGLKVIPDDALRHLRRAYFACVSFVDTLVGKVVDELDSLGLADSTIVTFVADHGYHLGENAHWGKVTNYERATHIPLMIHIPGVTDRGVETRSLVEAIDIYPTIVEAAGLTIVPRCPIQSSAIDTCTDGKSLIPLIDNPTHDHKKVVYSQIASGGQFMSYTIRTDRYRFVEWAEVKKKPRADGLWDIYMDWQLGGWQWWTGFFDLKVDPEERYNRTADPKYASIQLQLRNKLHNFVDRMYDQPKYFVKGH